MSNNNSDTQENSEERIKARKRNKRKDPCGRINSKKGGWHHFRKTKDERARDERGEVSAKKKKKPEAINEC